MAADSVLKRGLVAENPALVQLLGLCPLLAVSTSAVAGLGLGCATWLVLVVSAAFVSTLRGRIPPSVRLPAFVVVIAAAVTAIDLVLPVFLFDLHRKLGLFVPLIVTNCVVLARMETFASKHPLRPALLDASAMGIGFAAALIVLGLIRELIGTGCILGGRDILNPNAPDAGKVCVSTRGMLIALLPPGAFFVLAFLVIVWRWLQRPNDDARAGLR